MIKKQFVKSRNKTKVTFELDKSVKADSVQLIADFNDWAPVAFEHLKSGKWKLVQELEPSQQYQFRYIIEGNGNTEYLNDPEADSTVVNNQGTENAILNT